MAYALPAVHITEIITGTQLRVSLKSRPRTAPRSQLAGSELLPVVGRKGRAGHNRSILVGRVVGNNPDVGIISVDIYEEISGTSKIVNVDYSDIWNLQRFVHHRIINGDIVGVNRYVSVKF